MHVRVHLRQIATLCLWDVVLTQRIGIGPILCVWRKLQPKMQKITHSVNGPWINHFVNCMFSTLDSIFCTEDSEPDPGFITFCTRGSVDTGPWDNRTWPSVTACLLVEWIPGIIWVLLPAGWAVLSWYTELFCAGLEMKCEYGGGPC